MAIALSPPLIIADEPTSALDVVVQRVVAQTLLDVKRRLGVSMLLIGHDMGLQAQMVDRIAVMYAGNIVEVGPVDDIFADPLHPYTQRLIASVPTIRERKPLSPEARSSDSTMDLTPDLRRPRPSLPLRELKPDHFVAPSAG
jgi:ABC-type dipeptide/oligopeptide/nickel transport system ATPase component